MWATTISSATFDERRQVGDQQQQDPAGEERLAPDAATAPASVRTRIAYAAATTISSSGARIDHRVHAAIERERRLHPARPMRSSVAA